MNGVTQRDLAEFVAFLEARNLDAALAQVLHLLDAGVGVDSLVTSLFTPAQDEVGWRWQVGEWSIAQEQHASAIVDACLSATGAAASAVRARDERGWLVVGSVEDDWHALPARMIAESLRARGWKVTFVGASASAERLRSAFAAEQPHAALLSCSVAAYLTGAARCIDALADVGVPVVVGGRAFGPNGERASRIGAVGWAGGPVDAAEVLEGFDLRGRWDGRVRAHDSAQLNLLRNEAPVAALTDLFLRWPQIAGLGETELARVRTHLDLAVGSAAAGALLEDDGLLAEFAVWLDATVKAQEIQHPPTEDLIESVACALGPDTEWVRRQTAEAKGRISGGSLPVAAAPLYAGQMPAGAVPPEGAAGDHQEQPQPKPTATPGRTRLDDAAEAIRARMRAASPRVAARPSGDDAASDLLPRLRQQAEHLLADAAQGRVGGTPRIDLPAEPDGERSQQAAEGLAVATGARTSQVLDAARAQAARLLSEAEQEAARIRQAAVREAEDLRSAAEISANELLAWAEAESLEWLAEAGRQVVSHLDEVQAESGRILATARAEAARVAAEASRTQSDIAARAADAMHEAQQESERQLAQTSVTSSALLAKARSDAAAIIAEAQAEKTRLAEETEKLAASAAELLELRLNEVEQARAEAAEVRAAADAAIEADTRRLLGEAQADCDRIIAEAKAEAELIRRAALRDRPPAEVDLREAADPRALEPASREPEAPARRRRFRG